MRRDGLPRFVGESAAVREVLAISERVAASDSPALIQGESGTDKELVALTIHLQSPRSARPFVSVNCGARPDTRLETELFGHRRGAFSGAVAATAKDLSLRRPCWCRWPRSNAVTWTRC